MKAGAPGTVVDWWSSVGILYLGAAIGIMLMVGLSLLIVRMRKIRKESRETLSKRYISEDIICHDNMANYFGMESFQGKQIRGQGVLVLARNELYFLRLHPRMELCIPLKRIKRVVTPTSFLGKSISKPLLQVYFKDDSGAVNSVAWYVKDLAAFKNALKLQRKNAETKKRK